MARFQALCDCAEAERVAHTVLADGGSAADAIVSAFFASAAIDKTVLLGPCVVLVCGVGQGARIFDGRLQQPGLGVRRPRGLFSDQAIPAAASVAVPSSLGALWLLRLNCGKKTWRSLVQPGVVLAKQLGCDVRAEVLNQVARLGQKALVSSKLSGALLHVAGPGQGGNLTHRDLDLATGDEILLQLEANEHGLAVVVPYATGPTPKWSACAVDAQGVFAAAYFGAIGLTLEVDTLGIALSLAAQPVRRGIERTKPGSRLACATPMRAFYPDNSSLSYCETDSHRMTWNRDKACVENQSALFKR